MGGRGVDGIRWNLGEIVERGGEGWFKQVSKPGEIRGWVYRL